MVDYAPIGFAYHWITKASSQAEAAENGSALARWLNNAYHGNIKRWAAQATASRNATLIYLDHAHWTMKAFKHVSTPQLVKVLSKSAEQLKQLQQFYRSFGRLIKINVPGSAHIHGMPEKRRPIFAGFKFPAHFKHNPHVTVYMTLMSQYPYHVWRLLKIDMNTEMH